MTLMGRRGAEAFRAKLTAHIDEELRTRRALLPTLPPAVRAEAEAKLAAAADAFQETLQVLDELIDWYRRREH